MLTPALLASVAVAAGGGQDARFCPQPPPPRTTRIERYMADRRSFGFRADKAYVRKLVRRDMWEYDVGWIPATPAENRYLRLRDRLELGRAAERYLRRRPDVDGGVSVEDAWPREPYLLVRLTRDVRRHTRALERRARFPDNLRTMRVEHSERDLRRIQDRVDFDAHEADGFFVMGVGTDITRNVVRIELITKRTDHAAYFRAAYGPLVETGVIATELTSPECAAVTGYRLAPDGVTLTLVYETGGGATFDRLELVEHDDRVEVGVVEQGPNGARTGELASAQHTVALSRPLGARALVDMTTGERVRPARG